MKQQINNLKDYAELAQASYFYFDLRFDSNGIARKIYELDSEGNKIKDEKYPRGYKEIEVTLEHIVSKKYKGQEVLINLQQGNDIFTKMKNNASESFNFDKLNGEFGEIQARNFAERYEIKFHQPNTLTGFSATLFSDKMKNRFIVGFRGTEGFFNRDIIQDIALSLNTNPQSFALLDFLKFIKDIVKSYNKPIIFVGHSLGGYLAQVALIYCDEQHKNELSFSPKEVYTFNAPSIYGWNIPSIVLNPNTIKILSDFLGKSSVSVSEKITHIYDDGGVKIIASAQYGSRNRIPIYTGKNSHSIIPLTQTLYFYSYLLELESNNKTLKDIIANKQSNKATTNNTNTAIQSHNDLANYIHELNVFMRNVRIAMDILINEFDKKDQEKFPNDFLALFIYQINEIAYKLEALKEDSKGYFTPSIDKENIIEYLLQFIESGYFIQILGNEQLRRMRDQCKSSPALSIYEKLSLATCQPFSLVDNNGVSYINVGNYHEIYGYKGLGALLAQEWHEEFTNAKYKIIKGLYFNGNTYSSYTKYMIDNAQRKSRTYITKGQ